MTFKAKFSRVLKIQGTIQTHGRITIQAQTNHILLCYENQIWVESMGKNHLGRKKDLGAESRHLPRKLRSGLHNKKDPVREIPFPLDSIHSIHLITK